MGSFVDYTIDITTQVCPMTYVRTKLLIERMKIGQTCQVRLRGGEPLVNVPRALREDGHEVLDLREEPGSENVWLLTARKGAPVT